MPQTPENRFHFSRGLNTDGGPFFVESGFYKDGLNAMHNPDGSVNNRPGIELLDAAETLTINDKSDATYLFMPSLHFGEFVRTSGATIQVVLLRWGNKLKIYQGAFDLLDINTPTYEITLSDVSDEAWYYKTRFIQEGNTVIMVNPRSPIYKLTYGDSSGTNTFACYKIELAALNSKLFDVPRAATIGRAVPGWFSKEISLETGTASYVLLELLADVVPSYRVEVYLVDTDSTVTRVDPGSYSYAEAIDTELLLVTCTLTYTGTDGKSLRVYFGKPRLAQYNTELANLDIVVSDRDKNFNDDSSYSPRTTAQFAGRSWFSGVPGPIDSTLDNTYTDYGINFRKIWVSDIFPSSLVREEITRLNCKPVRDPLDADDNIPTPPDGGTIELDNAGRIYDLAPFGTTMFAATKSGVYGITGPEEYFSLLQVINKKIIDHPIGSKDPLITTEAGVMIFGDNEVFLINPGNQEKPLRELVANRITSLYGQIEPNAKRQSFARYDNYNRRGYYFYTDSDSGYIAANKYEETGLADKFLVYDIRSDGWFTACDISGGTWGVFDMVTVPADSYFVSTDYRYAPHKKVNLVLLGRKNGNYTEITFGILEGKKYCSDYYGTPYETAFSSYIETLNSLGQELGISSKKQIAKAIISMPRVEEDDADADGYYEYPGALYMSKRWAFADSSNAGPYFQYQLAADQNSWEEVYKQIYWPANMGSQALGGLKPGFNLFQYHTKIRGRGSSVAFRFGNRYGSSTLTGTIEEQEKPWKLQGYQLNLKAYKS